MLHNTDNRGARHGMSNLTDENILEIRRLNGIMSQSKIAKQFSISQPAVSAIINRKRWYWLLP
jgi:DNA-binding MarR family transcriptional regulator